ncbi:MAG: lysine--tRNA ligase [Candidatus Berkelbacteria bacterium]|nr:MAG: lysine--tRNA ligase [Candidatus Berkelbacteria bacterium]QQG51776.1 MAG: lysine--tRNA ligase [Candidatus Berkelbacteria bacterium]
MNQQARPESEIRLDKLQQLQKLGVNPYPAVVPEHLTLNEARQKKDGAKVAIVGRVSGIRGHGKSTFFDLVDEGDKLQAYFKQDEIGDKDYSHLALLDVGDFLWASGELFTTKAGEMTLKVKEYALLSKSLLPIPEHWHGLSDVETRYRSRALDFKINENARHLIEVRGKVVELIREFFIRHGFLEVHTPILQPIPGGAAAKPFKTRYNALEADFYLRIAPELYLKRLVAGGFNRVFEIGPSFRNEGLSHIHNPEFYSAEAYWAYQDYVGFMAATQTLVQELVKKVTGSLKVKYQGQTIDFSRDFAVRKYVEIVREDTGIDIEKLTDFKDLKKAVDEKKITFENQKISVWSELVDELFKKVCRDKIMQPTFVIDYPIALQPLAKRHRANPELAEQFQLIAAGGFELVKAYSELNDPIDQEARFREQMKMRDAGWEEAQMLDENFIEALKFGMPPTAGWGLGIERLVMLLTDQHSIKEVIPFPTLRPKK